MKLRRLAALTLSLCLMIAVMSGCAGSAGSTSDGASPGGGAASQQPGASQPQAQETADTKYQKTVTIAPSLDFTSMDPQNDTGATAKGVYLMVFNTLVDYDTMESEYIPGLATSWEQIDDTTWEFKLRENVKFHDGGDFTAEDVKFTIERGLGMNASAPRFSSIKEVTAVDSHTVRFGLSAPDNDLVYKLCEPNTVMLSANAFSSLSDEEANKIGTGAFKFNEWVQGDYLSLLRNDDFWGGAKKTEEIIIRYIPEASSRLIALQTGEIDFCVDPPAVDLHYVEEDSDLVLWRIPSTNIRHFMMNVNVEPFDNQLVRQAVAHAINREDLVTLVYEGNATPAYNVMHTMSEFFVDVDYYEFDLEKAKALLTEAGYPDGFSTSIYSSSGTVQKAVDSVLQAQLAEIGIKLDIQALETATFNSGAGHGGTYPMAVDGWSGYAIGPDNALRNAFHTKGSFNRSNIEDSYVDDLIDQALSTKDHAERAKMYADIQQYVMDYGNWIPLAIEQINVGVRADLQGFELPHGLFHHWSNLYVIEE